MSDHHRTGRLNRRTAERLLDGADGHARIHALLTAAAAPARPEELAGEDAAVAAFKAAPRAERKSRAAALRRFLTVKVLVLVGGSLILTGGAAYATITGHLPGGSPAPSPSPTLHGQTGTGQDDTPITQFSPSAPPSTPPSMTQPGKSRSPHASKTPPGKTSAPGQQNKTTVPRRTPTPHRGPGDNNGTTPPREHPTTGPGNGNGNGNGGSPRGGNSDIGRPD